MTIRHFTAALILGTLAFAALPGAASAATAQASDKISIFDQPRYQTNEIVGMLQAGEEVTVDRCTPNGNWCRVLGGQAPGWVPASYLIGAAAKIDATPMRSLTESPTDHVRVRKHIPSDF